ncbi:MAG TPA: PKD domain-containing protein [Nitrospiria bacterium]|nr:PKD domain-containing protein [Nitrospiria bacterium]
MQRNRALIFATIAFVPLLSVSSVWANPLFGPKTYTRERGGPEAFKESFQICALSGVYSLIVENSVYTKSERDGKEEGNEKHKKDKDTKEKHKKKERKGKENKVSAAEIEINGEKIIEEDDFNNKLARIERTILLPPGENKMELEIEGDPGPFITVTIECASGCIEPRITHPTAGATLNQSTTLIQGNLSHVYGEVGVTVSGQLAQFNGLEFAAVGVPLNIGQNTITATATDACGLQATATTQVNVESLIEPLVILSAAPNAVVAPVTVRFRALAIPPNPVASYRWNFTTETEPEVSFTYESPGLYLPEVTVTDIKGLTYSATAVVKVLDSTRLNTLLQTKWAKMRDALGQGNFEQALGYFTRGSQDRYREVFEAIRDKLGEEAAALHDIVLVSFSGNTAKYRIQRTEIINGQPQILTYWVYFIQDADGIWRIRQF